MRDAPQELIDAVLAFAHSDAATLRAARLVSRAWNVSARVHLFRSLELSLVPGRRGCSSSSAPNPAASSSAPAPIQTKSTTTNLDKLQRALSVLESSAGVRESVREVTLESSLSSPHSSSASHCPAAVAAEASALALSLILTLLPRVRALHLRSLRLSFPFSSSSSSSTSSSSASSHQLPPPLLHALTRLLHSPTLSHLEIWNCELESAEVLLGLLNHACSLSPTGSGSVASVRVSHVRFTHTSTASGPSPTSASSSTSSAGTVPVPIASSVPSAFVTVSTAPSSDSASELASEDENEPEDDTFRLSSVLAPTPPCTRPSDSDLSVPSSPSSSSSPKPQSQHQRQRSAPRHLTLESTPLAPLLLALDNAQRQSQLNTIDLRSVRHLSLVHMGGGGDMSSVQSLLERIGEGLEVLDLRGGHSHQTPSSRTSNQTLNLGPLPNLTTLRLSGLQWTPTQCPADALSALLSSLSSSSSSSTSSAHQASASSLQSLHLTVTALRLRSSRPPSPSPSSAPSPPTTLPPSTSPASPASTSPTSPTPTSNPHPHPPTPLPTAPWSTLGRALAHPHLRALKRVAVKVVAGRAGDVDAGALVGALAQGGDGEGEVRGRVSVSVDVF